MKRIICKVLLFPLIFLSLVSCSQKKADDMLFNKVGGVKLVVRAPGINSKDIVSAIQDRLECLNYKNCFVSPQENNEYIIKVPAVTQVDLVAGAFKPGSGFGFWRTYTLSELGGVAKLYEYDEWITHPGYTNYACVGLSSPADTAFVNMRIASEGIYRLLPYDCRLMWTSNVSDSNVLELVAIKRGDGKPLLDGKAIYAVEVGEDDGKPCISITMNEYGTKRWRMITRDNIGRQLAIVFNGKVISYPMVTQEISVGRTIISGNFTREEINAMASQIASQTLRPLPLKIVSAEYVAPTRQ